MVVICFSLVTNDIEHLGCHWAPVHHLWKNGYSGPLFFIWVTCIFIIELYLIIEL